MAAFQDPVPQVEVHGVLVVQEVGVVAAWLCHLVRVCGCDASVQCTCQCGLAFAPARLCTPPTRVDPDHAPASAIAVCPPACVRAPQIFQGVAPLLPHQQFSVQTQRLCGFPVATNCAIPSPDGQWLGVCADCPGVWLVPACSR